MAHTVTHTTGAQEAEFPSSRFDELLDELSTADPLKDDYRWLAQQIATALETD